MPTPGSLTPKQQRFVTEYLTDLNATAAYRRAGYKARNDNVAAASGAALLRIPKVAAAVAAAQSARNGRTEVGQDYVVKRLKREAELDGEGASHSARVAALKLLGQHAGMFAEKHVVSGEGGGPVVIKSLVVVRPADAPGDGDG